MEGGAHLALVVGGEVGLVTQAAVDQRHLVWLSRVSLNVQLQLGVTDAVEASAVPGLVVVGVGQIDVRSEFVCIRGEEFYETSRDGNDGLGRWGWCRRDGHVRLDITPATSVGFQ